MSPRSLGRVEVALACVVASFGEWALQAAGPGISGSGRWLVEILGWLSVGVVLGRLRGWQASAAWPGVLLLTGALLRTLPGSGIPFLAGELPQPVGIVGVGVTAVVLVRVVEDGLQRLPALLRSVAAVGLTVLGLLAGRMVLLVSEGVDPTQLRVELASLAGTRSSEAVGRPPVVLLTVDTLRWDDAQRMRSVARLAARGGYWRRAMSTASWTVPALASLHTGLLPRDHHASVRPGPRPTPMDPGVTTLAERLRDRGYVSAAFLTNTFTATALGFARGFDVQFHPDEDLPQPLTFAGAGPVPDATERAIAWMASAPTDGAFLWVHLDDPHLPYTRLPVDADNPLNRALDGRVDLLKVSAIRSGMLKLDAPARAALREVYRAQVDAADERLSRVLDAVESRWPEAIVVLTADHGEEFFDHGNFEHGHSHHGEVIDVPLVIVGPGMGVGERTDTASLVDVVPTVLGMVDSGTPVRAVGVGVSGGDSAGTSPPGTDPPGVDLRAPARLDRIVTADGNLYYGPGLSARQGVRRAIVGIGEYDLVVDPEERVPLPPGPLTEAARAAAGEGPGEAVDVRTEGLRALGYVE